MIPSFLRCPDCTKKGVYVRLKGNVFTCRYCPWYANVAGDYEEDVANRGRLAGVNPDAEVVVSWVEDGMRLRLLMNEKRR